MVFLAMLSTNLQQRRLKNSYVTDDGLLVLSQEIEEGNIEYKLQLINLSAGKIEQLASQMKWRINEGNGEALYIIGISDNGFPEGISNEYLNESHRSLKEMTKLIKAKASVICERKGKNGYLREFLIREKNNNKYIDIRIVLLGDNAAGKSTLVGVLCRGDLDDGKGSMRMYCFNHQHELESGETSSLSHQILGFDTEGNCVNNETLYEKKWGEIVEESHKIISFLDLPGRPSSRKTTISAISGRLPDYAFIVIDSPRGMTQTTQEYWNLCAELGILVIVIITKTDMNDSKFEEQIKNYLNLRKHFYSGYTIINNNSKQSRGILTNITGMIKTRIVPIFLVSNTTGEGISILKKFLNLLPQCADWSRFDKNPSEFRIDKASFIEGIGTIVGGITTQGKIINKNTLSLGPNTEGKFKDVSISSIYRNYQSVDEIKTGQTGTICLKGIGTSFVKRGMVLIDEKMPKKAYWKFVASVTILYHTLQPNKKYQPIIHCLTIRQPAKITNIKNKKGLKTSDRTQLTFKFMQKPEYIKSGMKVIFNGNRCKGIGTIIKVF